MANVLNSLKVYPGFHDLVSPDDVKCLLKAIVDARIYIKNVYRHQIKNHSKIKVRLSCYFRLLFPKNYKFIFWRISSAFFYKRFRRIAFFLESAIPAKNCGQQFRNAMRRLTQMRSPYLQTMTWTTLRHAYTVKPL